MEQACESWNGYSRIGRACSRLGACLPDAEHERAIPLALRLENIPGLVEETRNIDCRQGVRAFDDDHGARFDPSQGLARLERGEGAFQSPEVQVGLAHDALDIVRGAHNMPGS
jgi:hypothetical protein